MEEFYTVREITIRELIVEKSRFIGIAVPATSPGQIAEAMARIREDYPNARHYVYAWRLFEGNIEKSSDDGEPQGTGGRPVLDQLQHHKVWNVLLVAVRYFGGVLLGTGGLSRAYGSIARLALTEAELIKRTCYAVWRVESPYEWFEPLKYQLSLRDWRIQETEFLDVVRFMVLTPKKDEDLFNKWFADFTGKRVFCVYARDAWV